MLIKKLFLSFSVLILFASVVSCASETPTSTEPKEEPKEEVISIAINAALGMKVGIKETLQLAVNIATMEGVSEDVEWSSANENIATVDTNGLVTGVATGTVTITVTSTADNSKKASVSIEVVPAVGEVWNQVSVANTNFSARSGHQAFLGDNGRLWVIGGYDDSFKNDIWYSDDNGTNWNQVSVDNNHFSSRAYHQVFLGDNGRLWVIGGNDSSRKYDDIWYSDDKGTNWSQVMVSGSGEHFSGRSGHQSFLGENGRLWVIGGWDGNYNNDIWYSDDNGSNWTKVMVSGTHFSIREFHQAFLGEDGRLWVMGGKDNSRDFNDIWYSDDQGTNWTEIPIDVNIPRFSARAYYQAFLGEDGRLWVIGGIDDNNKLNDIWYSDNEGVNWNQVSVANTHFSVRQYHQAFLGDAGRLWVIGGFGSSRLNDIWYSDGY